MHEKINQPLYILKGKNYFRFLFIFLLTGIVLLGIYSIPYIGYIMLFVIFAAIFGLINIRFPYLYLFKDHFVIKKKCIFEKYSRREIFKYDELKDIEFVKGQINWPQLIVQTIVGKGAYGGFSKSDQMVLKLQNDRKRIFYRFGSRNEFIKTINRIKGKISPATNSGS